MIWIVIFLFILYSNISMQFENWFIKNEELLLENSNIDDLLNRESEITKFSDKIDEIHWSTIRWIVWQFWIWKSTLINNVKRHRTNKNKNEKRFDFDAWKYPDRKDLREWFVLDFAKQVNEEEFNKAKKKIDWEQNKKAKAITKWTWNIISWFWNLLVWNIISGLSEFFKTSPARRVFEIQDIFQKLIDKINEKKIIIVVEDIDRSWDAWIFFLETLKQFISKNDFWKGILVIMPLWTNEYYKNIDSYLKPIDYFDFFVPWAPKLEKFINKIFIDEIINDKELKWPLKDFLEWLFIHYPKDINLRKIKLIIRKANQNHIIMCWKLKDMFDIDRRINIIFETMKYIEYNESKNSLFEQLRINKDDSSIDKNTIIWSYVYNLVWFTIRWWKSRYRWERSSLYKKAIDKNTREYKDILNIDAPLNIKFYWETTNKEMIWCLYKRKDWEDIPEAFVLPFSYFDY